MRDEQPRREEEAQNKGKREMDGSKRARRIHMSRKVKIIIREMDGSSPYVSENKRNGRFPREHGESICLRNKE